MTVESYSTFLFFIAILVIVCYNQTNVSGVCMEFRKVENFSWVELTDEQQKFVTKAEKINMNVSDKPDNYRIYDVFENEIRIANVVLRFYPKTPKQVFLWDFGIDKKYQRMHYGSKILECLEDILKKEGFTSLITTCMAGNSALTFYEKNGFSVTDEINEVSDGRHIHEFDLEKTL